MDRVREKGKERVSNREDNTPTIRAMSTCEYSVLIRQQRVKTLGVSACSIILNIMHKL